MIINNKLIPFKGFSAMAIWPFIFVRKDSYLPEKTLRHEKIHHEQQKEVSLIGLLAAIFLNLYFGLNWWFFLIPVLLFYVLYVLIYLWQLINVSFEGKGSAYRNICFEREAYNNIHEKSYLECRKSFAWVKYLWRK